MTEGRGDRALRPAGDQARAIGEDVDADELGGPAVAAGVSGSAHLVVDDEREALDAIKRVPLLPARLGRPARAGRPPPVGAGARRRGAADARADATRAAATTCARCSRRSSTRDSLFSRGASATARSLICALARIEGQAVGVVASQPMQRAGVLDVPGADEGGGVHRPLRHVQPAAGLPPGRARADDRHRRRARRHPRRLRARRRRASPARRCRRSRSSCARPTAAGTSRSAAGRSSRTSARLADAPRWASWPRHRRPHRLPAPARARCSTERGQGGARRARRRARGRLGRRVRALGGGGAHHPRRRHRPSPHASGHRRRHRVRVGQPAPHQLQTLTRRRPCRQDRSLISVSSSATSIRPSRTGARSWPSSIPASSRSPSSSSSAGRPARTSCPRRRSSTRRGRRSSFSARSTTARSAGGSRSAASTCTTSASPPPTCRTPSARLDESGIKLTSTELQNDPKIPWQHWTFISPESSHGTLVELAYPYRPVDGTWEPGEGAPTTT